LLDGEAGEAAAGQVRLAEGLAAAGAAALAACEACRCVTIPQIIRGGKMLAELTNWVRSTWYNKYAVMVLSAAIGLGAHETIPWSSLSASDWGTWIGSVGTVFTLIGTIWLATAEKRNQRRQEKARAVVAAASLEVRLETVEAALEDVIQNILDKDSLADFSYSAQARIITAAGTWNDDEILPLLILPNHVCAKLSGIRTAIADSAQKIEAEQWRSRDRDADAQAQKDLDIMQALVSQLEVITACLRECQLFARKVIRG
jgi:hypothetical protein